MKAYVMLLLMIFLVAGSNSGFAQDKAVLIEEQKASGFASYVVVIPIVEFRREVLIRLANEYLGRYEKLELLQVGVYTDRKTALDSTGKKVFDFTYSAWKNEFENRKQGKPMRAAEFLKYGSAATLRIRYPDRRVEEIAITGETTFHPPVNGMTPALLHVSFVRQGFGESKELIPHFYFSVPKRITPEEAQLFATSFRRTSGVSKIEIHLRQDEWFIFDAHYPWVNAFTQSEKPPTQTEAAKSVEFLCRPTEEQSCYQSSGGTT